VVRVRALSNGLALSRAGIAVVGARSAVTRNRLRRRVRAELAAIIAGRPGLDLVVTVPAAQANVTAAALGSDLSEALTRAAARLASA
jgi:ribonuclease P protein component